MTKMCNNEKPCFTIKIATYTILKLIANYKIQMLAYTAKD